MNKQILDLTKDFDIQILADILFTKFGLCEGSVRYKDYQAKEYGQRTKAIDLVGGLLLKGIRAGTLDYLLKESLKIHKAGIKRVDRHSKREPSVSSMAIKDESGKTESFNETLDRLQYKHSQSNDPDNKAEILGDKEVEALNYITGHSQEIDKRIGKHTSDILTEIVKGYEQGIAYADIGQKLGISKQAVYRLVFKVKNDTLLTKDLPLLRQILAIREETFNKALRFEDEMSINNRG